MSLIFTQCCTVFTVAIKFGQYCNVVMYLGPASIWIKIYGGQIGETGSSKLSHPQRILRSKE